MCIKVTFFRFFPSLSNFGFSNLPLKDLEFPHFDKLYVSNLRKERKTQRVMSKILSASNETRVWTTSFLAKNTLIGPLQGNVAELVENVQFLHTPSTKFKVSTP